MCHRYRRTQKQAELRRLWAGETCGARGQHVKVLVDRRKVQQGPRPADVLEGARGQVGRGTWQTGKGRTSQWNAVGHGKVGQVRERQQADGPRDVDSRLDFINPLEELLQGGGAGEISTCILALSVRVGGACVSSRAISRTRASG